MFIALVNSITEVQETSYSMDGHRRRLVSIVSVGAYSLGIRIGILWGDFSVHTLGLFGALKIATLLNLALQFLL